MQVYKVTGVVQTLPTVLEITFLCLVLMFLAVLLTVHCAQPTPLLHFVQSGYGEHVEVSRAAPGVASRRELIFLSCVRLYLGLSSGFQQQSV